MRIAYYDDEAVHRDIIRDYLLNWSLFRNIEIFIQEYKSSQELFQPDTCYDILFLDIYLENNLDGIEIGKKLRDNGYKGIIVLLTFSEENTIKGYEVEAFRYILKPLFKNEI